MSQKEIDMRKFNTVVGITPVVKDVENHAFTEYVADNRDALVQYAKSMLGLDVLKAEDFVHDLWLSYKKNEDDGKCFSSDKGHDVFITIGESVKARMKKMKLKSDPVSKESTYLKVTNSSPVVPTHFTSDTDEDDAMQKRISMTTKVECDSLDNVLDEDLKEEMMSFVACTNKCRVSGMLLLERLPQVSNGVESGVIGCKELEYMNDLWIIPDAKTMFSHIISVFYKDPDFYFFTLNSVREELEKCKQLLEDHKLEVAAERMACRKLLHI